MFQLLQVLSYMHAHGVVHRDLKPENILLSTNQDELKVCDLGLARHADEEMTGYLATRYYRAPEFMLTWRTYGAPVDVWSAGCILAELAIGRVLFPGVDHVHHLRLIISLIGSPPEAVISRICSLSTRQYLSFLPHTESTDFSAFQDRLTPVGVDLLRRMLEFDPMVRISAAEALQHPFFSNFPNTEMGGKVTEMQEDRDEEGVDWCAKLLSELEVVKSMNRKS
jgi:p38 MAP kinase